MVDSLFDTSFIKSNVSRFDRYYFAIIGVKPLCRYLLVYGF